MADETSIRPFEWLTSPASLSPIFSSVLSNHYRGNGEGCGVLHVGSGSSVWGEHILNSSPAVTHVVNVDKDEETLQMMKDRWKREEQLVTTKKKLDFVCVDLVQDRIPYPDHTFDVVVDKSTLDCTLCSDHATSRLLHEVYRLLKPSGGTYLLVSFHSLDLLLPLLEQCPGTNWAVSHSVIRREVEDLISSGGSREPQPVEPDPCPASLDERQTVNVIVARRCSDETASGELDIDAIYQHVNQQNDEWYKTKHPILTRERLQAIRQAFVQQGPSITLPECYQVLFTDAEREHLEYEYFLEDWHAFCEQQATDCSGRSSMTVDIALSFLEEMQ